MNEYDAAEELSIKMSGAASQAYSFKYKLQIGKQPRETEQQYQPKVRLGGKPSITTKDRWLTVVNETVRPEEESKIYKNKEIERKNKGRKETITHMYRRIGPHAKLSKVNPST